MASAVVPKEVIARCQERWCIISTDKLTQTTTVCCKYLAMTSAIKEYINSTFYERMIVDPEHIIMAHTQYIDSLGLTPMIECINAQTGQTEKVANHTEQLPHLSVASKQLKAVHRYRYIASSRDVALTPMFEWLGRALKAMTVRCHELWTTVQREADIPEEHVVPTWMLDSADAVTEQVENVAYDRAPQGDMECRDVEQLFTNIPHALLLQKLEKCIDMVWDHMTVQVREGDHRGNQECVKADIVLVVPGKYGDRPPVFKWNRNLAAHETNSKHYSIPSVHGCGAEAVD